MRLLYLLFPDLPIALARRAHPHLVERPLALIAGTGPESVVTAVSPAASRTIRPRMLAGEARLHCPGAMFLPDNGGACLDELERLALIIRKYATVSVAIAARTSLLADLSQERDEREAATRIRTLARAWACTAVQAGIGSSRTDALEAAAGSRRGIGMSDPREVAEPALREAPGPLSLTVALADDSRDGPRVTSALRRLAVVVAAYGWDFREVRMSHETTTVTRSIRLRFESPVDVPGAEARILAALAALPEVSRGHLTIALGRLAPRVEVEPLPTLAVAG